MKLKIILLSILVLSACSGSGGTVGGLFPAPKFWKGEVDGDKYISPDRRFSIKLPWETSSPMHTYMHIDEGSHESENGEGVTYIIFGPAIDQNKYHVALVRPEKNEGITSIENRAKYAITNFNNAYSAEMKSVVTEVSFNVISVNNRKAVRAVYDFKGGRYKRSHIYTFIDLGNSTVNIMAESIDDGWSIQNLLSRDNSPYLRLVNSFALVD